MGFLSFMTFWSIYYTIYYIELFLYHPFDIHSVGNSLRWKSQFLRKSQFSSSSSGDFDKFNVSRYSCYFSFFSPITFFIWSETLQAMGERKRSETVTPLRVHGSRPNSTAAGFYPYRYTLHIPPVRASERSRGRWRGGKGEEEEQSKAEKI